MKRIRITRRGVFRQNGMVPVGTELDMPDDFSGWPGKWVEVVATKGKTLEVATPAPEPEPEPVDDARQHAVAAYQARFGKKPHHKMKTENIWEALEEVNDATDND